MTRAQFLKKHYSIPAEVAGKKGRKAAIRHSLRKWRGILAVLRGDPGYKNLILSHVYPQGIYDIEGAINQQPPVLSLVGTCALCVRCTGAWSRAGNYIPCVEKQDASAAFRDSRPGEPCPLNTRALACFRSYSPWQRVINGVDSKRGAEQLVAALEQSLAQEKMRPRRGKKQK